MNLLVVEDDVSTAVAIMESMNAWGHRVESSGTGKDALAKLMQKEFHLILLDIFLPDCRGYELIPQFKGMWPEIGIVTMTGFNSRKLELRVRKQGINYYMIKPVDMKALKDVLDHISKKKSKEVRKE